MDVIHDKKIYLGRILTRVRPRFFDQVGHQTTNASIGINIFSLFIVHVRLTKIMNNLVKDLKILSFKVIFQCIKFVESFKKNNSGRIFDYKTNFN